MKKQFLFATLALATMFTACSKEEELSKNESGTPVNFVIGGIGARTVTDASNYAVNFVAGESIGLFGYGFKDGASFVNKEYSVNSDLSGLTAPDGEPIYYMGDSNPTIYAYRPYLSTNTLNEVTHTILDDQTITEDENNNVTIDNFNPNDFMVATSTIEGSTISLTFEHKMAMVELNFGENLSALGVSQVSMRTINGIKYNLATNETTLQDGIINVNMYNVDTNKFWAIVPPQTVTGDGNTVLFTITAGGRTFYYTPANAVEEKFTANKVRKITLDIAGTGDDEPIAAVFKLASVTVNDWGTEEDDNTTTVVEKKLNHIATLSAPVTGNNRSACTDDAPWLNHSLGSASYDATEEYIAITKGEQSGWYNNTLYYWAGSNVSLSPGYQYTVSFDVKAIKEGEETGSAKIDYVLALKNSYDVDGDGENDNNAVYVPNCLSSENTSASTRISITDLVLNAENYTTLSCTIDPAYLAKDVATSAKTVYSNNQSCDIVISLIPGTSDVTYYIKNVKIVQQ